MRWRTILSVFDLQANAAADDWVILDCRFALGDPSRGRLQYLEEHIPGAQYAHLEEDLSGPVVPGKTGRHPLPAVDTFAATLSQWGVAPGIQVVAYDDRGGAIAARLWWMLNWLGHDTVALLDGGWQKWKGEGFPVRGGTEAGTFRSFVPRVMDRLLCTAQEISQSPGMPGQLLVDARAADRYRGEVEPFDPVAGHIPGAVSMPYQDNLREDGTFHSKETLRLRYQGLLDDTPADNVVCYCGSGVTAPHNLVALAHAGLGLGRLYAGSWSEWIADPEHPIAKG